MDLTHISETPVMLALCKAAPQKEHPRYECIRGPDLSEKDSPGFEKYIVQMLMSSILASKKDKAGVISQPRP